MRNDTRKLFNALAAQIATLSGVDSAFASFSVEPSVQQTLEQRIQESSDFFGRINVIGVQELKGEKVGIGVGGTIASRTEITGSAERQPQDVSAMDKRGYECFKTDFDTAIPYALIDSWAKFKDFQTKLRDAIIKRQALDRLMIGFHGTSAAATTNRSTNPLLQDVNIGWLEQYRQHAADRVLKEVAASSGKVKIGDSVAVADGYKTLDALVYDVIQMLDPWHRANPGLVVIAGRDLVHDKYFPLVNQAQPATEKLATDVILTSKRLGGLPVAEVPYIPANTLMVTALDNLSLYYQTGGRRRLLRDNPAKNRIENFESSNDAYVVEDYGLGAVVENIEIV
ncbi:MAG: phage major capsid protein, P2 family [Pseudomonadota bacterium]|nr:phage major capsid protein, P2 family [Pseudomonadota bacterium]